MGIWKRALGAIALTLLSNCSRPNSEAAPPSPKVMVISDGHAPVIKGMGCVAGPPNEPFQVVYEGRQAADWDKPKSRVYWIRLIIDECDLVYTLSGPEGAPFTASIARCDIGDVACINAPTLQSVAVYREPKVLKYADARSFRTAFDEPVEYLGASGSCERYRITGNHESLTRHKVQEYTFCPGKGVTQIIEVGQSGQAEMIFHLISTYGLLSQVRAEKLTLYGY